MPTVGIGRNGGVCAQRRCMSAQRRCMSRFLLAGRTTAVYVKGSKAHRRCMCEFCVICGFFIDELLKDCPGAPLVITLQQLPGR
jgi:hypothetical protein